MKKVLCAIAAPLLVASMVVSTTGGTVWACINLYARNLSGDSVDYQGYNRVLAAVKGDDHADKDEWRKKRDALKAKADGPAATFENRADYASIGIYLGEVPQAIEQLEALEKEKPGESIIASNLGTAYELNGNVEKALEWIKEGIHRNPTDHKGTEWLHVKILEAKLALAHDGNWLKTHSVLELDFGADAKPSIPIINVKDFQGVAKSGGKSKKRWSINFTSVSNSSSRPNPSSPTCCRTLRA
jgi:tetratricopeptide (TPR) repeat protein